MSQFGPGLAVSGVVALIIKSKPILLLCLRAIAVAGSISGKIYKKLSGLDAIPAGETDIQAVQDVIQNTVKVAE